MAQKLVLLPAQAIALSHAIHRFLTDRMLSFTASTHLTIAQNDTPDSPPTCLEHMSYCPLVRLYSRLHKVQPDAMLRVKVGTPEIIALLRVIPLPAVANELSAVLEQVTQLATNQEELLNAA